MLDPQVDPTVDPTVDHPLNLKAASLGDFQILPLQDQDSVWIAQRLSCLDPWHTLGYSPKSLQHYLTRADPCLRCMTLVSDVSSVSGVTDLVGVFCVRFPWLLGASLELFAIFPDHQRRGLGTTALTWLEQRVATKTRNLWILVSAFNEPANAFYRRQGYQPVGKIEGLIQEGRDEILLRKQLPRPVT